MYGFDARHLARAHADRRSTLEKYDRVRLHVLDRRPGESKLLPFVFGRRPAGHGPARRSVKPRAVPLLDQQATWYRAHVVVEQSLMRRLGGQDDHVLAPGEDILCFVENFGSDHDVSDDLNDLLG